MSLLQVMIIKFAKQTVKLNSMCEEGSQAELREVNQQAAICAGKTSFDTGVLKRPPEMRYFRPSFIPSSLPPVILIQHCKLKAN